MTMMATASYKYHEYIDNYLDAIKNDEVVVGKYMKKLPAIVEKELDKDNIYIDSDKIYDTKRVIESHSDITLLIAIIRNRAIALLLHRYSGGGFPRNAFIYGQGCRQE